MDTAKSLVFKTFVSPQTLRLPRLQSGRSGNYLGGAFTVLPCPEIEGVAFAQQKCPNFPLEFQPVIAAGIARGCAEARLQGRRLCGMVMGPESLKFHDVDTTEEGAERRARIFVLDQLWNQAALIESVSPAWRTPDVLDLARGHGLGGDVGQMPILADALEEAGCDNASVLAHLRTCTDHGGRCWVLDWLLGSET